MDTAMTRDKEYSTNQPIDNPPGQAPLYLAFELGWSQWKLGFSVGLGQRPRERTIDARDLGTLEQEIQWSRKRFGLPENAPVRSCYEAGRDGFWLHRYLIQAGVENQIVDSASIEVNRRAKRAKTDRMDVTKLLTMLIRYHEGEKKVWHVIRVPSTADEDSRNLHRELETLKGERTQHTNRLKGWLAGQGVQLEVTLSFLEELEQIKLWDGNPLPSGLHTRLAREYERRQDVQKQIRGLEKERLEAIRHAEGSAVEQVRRLLRLKGIGVNSAWLYVMEFFSWRQFRNRREVGALAGLTPTPYQSGESSHEQGISKAGNKHIRAIGIELAWGWLRFQPDSQLCRWYQTRFGTGSSRLRRIGIVALARKLLIALWNYLENRVIPEGAMLKTRLIYCGNRSFASCFRRKLRWAARCLSGLPNRDR
jgi:transposase